MTPASSRSSVETSGSTPVGREYGGRSAAAPAGRSTVWPDWACRSGCSGPGLWGRERALEAGGLVGAGSKSSSMWPVLAGAHSGTESQCRRLADWRALIETGGHPHRHATSDVRAEQLHA